MKQKKLLCFLIVLLTIYPLKEGRSETNKNNTNALSITIAADELESAQKSSIVTGKGHVEVTYKGYSVQADSMTLNIKTGKGSAKTDVLIHDQITESNIECEQADFNLKSKKGTLYNGRGDFKKEYFFSGKKIERTGDDTFNVYDGTFTTCIRNGSPSWTFSSKKAYIHLEHYAYLSHPTFRIKGIPVLYLPYLIVPVKTKRASGLLFPYLGNSGKDGYFINNSFFWAINEQSDATFYLDYMTKKGIRPGLEYRYTPSATTTGKIQASYLKEKDTKKEFWTITLDHKQDLFFDIHNVTSLDMAGSNNADKLYADDTDMRTRRNTDSYTSFTKNWDNTSLQLQARYRKSIEQNINERFSQLPTISFFSQQQRIEKTSLFFSLESSYTFFLHEKNNESANIHRTDIHPTISIPFTTLPFFTFTPSAGVRNTFYSKGKDDNGNQLGGFSRELYDLHTEIEGPKLVKIFFNKQSSPVYKHLIKPRILYTYIPDSDTRDRKHIWYQIENGTKTTGFDAIDTIEPTHKVTYSLFNRILHKTPNGVTEVLRMEIKNSYHIKKTITQRPFSTIRADLDSTIFDSFILNIDGEYNIYDKKIDTANIETIFNYTDLWDMRIERRYTRGTTTFWTGAVGLKAHKNLSLRYRTRYDERLRLPVENDYQVSYMSQCWGISLNFVDRQVILDGQRQGELKFFLLITLKGIGSFGKKKRP